MSADGSAELSLGPLSPADFTTGSEQSASMDVDSDGSSSELRLPQFVGEHIGAGGHIPSLKASSGAERESLAFVAPSSLSTDATEIPSLGAPLANPGPDFSLEVEKDNDPLAHITLPIVYMAPAAHTCRIVHWLCEEAAIPFMIKPVWLFNGDNRKPQYTENVTKTHTVPALRHNLSDGSVYYLHESHAIMQYLCELQGPQVYGEYFGRTVFERADITKYVVWANSTLVRAFMMDFTIPVYYRPFWVGTKHIARPTDDEVDAVQNKWPEFLLMVEEWLGEGGDAKTFLIADRFTAADIVVGSALAPVYMNEKGRAMLNGFPNVATYLQRLQKRPHCQTAFYASLLYTSQLRKHFVMKSDEPGTFEFLREWEKRFEKKIAVPVPTF